jgi:hypothetical protein
VGPVAPGTLGGGGPSDSQIDGGVGCPLADRRRPSGGQRARGCRPLTAPGGTAGGRRRGTAAGDAPAPPPPAAGRSPGGTPRAPRTCETQPTFETHTKAPEIRVCSGTTRSCVTHSTTYRPRPSSRRSQARCACGAPRRRGMRRARRRAWWWWPPCAPQVGTSPSSATCHVPTGRTYTCHVPTDRPYTCHVPTGRPSTCHVPTGRRGPRLPLAVLQLPPQRTRGGVPAQRRGAHGGVMPAATNFISTHFAPWFLDVNGILPSKV